MIVLTANQRSASRDFLLPYIGGKLRPDKFDHRYYLGDGFMVRYDYWSGYGFYYFDDPRIETIILLGVCADVLAGL